MHRRCVDASVGNVVDASPMHPSAMQCDPPTESTLELSGWPLKADLELLRWRRKLRRAAEAMVSREARAAAAGGAGENPRRAEATPTKSDSARSRPSVKLPKDWHKQILAQVRKKKVQEREEELAKQCSRATSSRARAARNAAAEGAAQQAPDLPSRARIDGPGDGTASRCAMKSN
eukprot:5799442-Pyramimonas_sp.AAC.1